MRGDAQLFVQVRQGPKWHGKLQTDRIYTAPCVRLLLGEQRALSQLGSEGDVGSAASPDAGLSLPSDGSAVIETLRTRFHRGVFWSVAAAVATSGFNFILNVVVARLLGREGFGQFGMVQTTIATIAGIAQLAMGFTATKFVAEFRSSDPGRAGRIIGLCSVVSLLTGSLAATALYVGAPWLALTSLKAPQLAGSLQLAGIMVFFTVLTGYQIGTLAGLESYRLLAVLTLASGASNLIAAAIGTYMWGLDGAIGGVCIGSAIQWMVFRSAMDANCRRHGITISRRDYRLERSVFFSFALPAALAGFSSMPALWLANAFLVRQHDGFSQMALYTATFSLRSLVFFLPSLLNRVSMSLLNHQKGIRNWEGYRRVFRTNFALTVVSVVIAAGAVAFVGVPVLALFGKDFRSGYPVLLVLLLSAIVEAVMSSMYQVVQAESKMWASMFLIAVPRDLLIVVCAYRFCPAYGALGLAAAFTVGHTVACISTAVLVARIGGGASRRPKGLLDGGV